MYVGLEIKCFDLNYLKLEVQLQLAALLNDRKYFTPGLILNIK